MLLGWYRRHGRDLPWRHTSDPYAILVSEMMLQQTQVARVIPKFHEFMQRFPTLRTLSAASLREVLRVWSGLGYNGRARRLWQCARQTLGRHHGRLPAPVAELRALPGVGRYTAGALAVFAFGGREVAVDTNVRRVIARALLGNERAGIDEVWKTARAVVPRNAGKWHHALMDVGALFCRARPNCDACPLRRVCGWNAKSPARRRINSTATFAERYKGSRREHRGRVIRALTGARSMTVGRLGPQVKDGFRTTDLPWLLSLLEDLARDGLVAVDRKSMRARIA